MKRITVVRSSWWPAKRATASRERPRRGCGNGRRTWRARPGRVELRYQNRLPRAKAALFRTLESRRSRSMSRRLRYHVAVSLDGFIAGPNGLADQRTLPVSGIVALAYAVPGPAPRIGYIKAAKIQAEKRKGTGKLRKRTIAKKRFTK